MLDLAARPLKDRVVDPLIQLTPHGVTPTSVTVLAFLVGLLAPLCSALGHVKLALTAWALNRVLDGVDGALARQRGLTSSMGGLLDIVCDFTIYSLIPIGIASSQSDVSPSAWMASALLLGSFHVNNVVLFYLAALPAPKAPPAGAGKVDRKHLTSLRMMPALVEGTESIVFFTAMIACPRWFVGIASMMTAAVVVNVVQRLLTFQQQVADEVRTQ